MTTATKTDSLPNLDKAEEKISALEDNLGNLLPTDYAEARSWIKAWNDIGGSGTSHYRSLCPGLIGLDGWAEIARLASVDGFGKRDPAVGPVAPRHAMLTTPTTTALLICTKCAATARKLDADGTCGECQHTADPVAWNLAYEAEQDRVRAEWNKEIEDALGADEAAKMIAAKKEIDDAADTRPEVLGIPMLSSFEDISDAPPCDPAVGPVAPRHAVLTTPTTTIESATVVIDLFGGARALAMGPECNLDDLVGWINEVLTDVIGVCTAELVGSTQSTHTTPPMRSLFFEVTFDGNDGVKDAHDAACNYEATIRSAVRDAISHDAYAKFQSFTSSVVHDDN